MEQGRQSITIDEELAGQRVDRALSEALGEFSRAEIQRLIASGEVRIDGHGVRPATRLSAGDVVTLPLSAGGISDDGLVAAPGLELDVIHADEALLVINKAPGRVVHPAAGHADDTLVNALVARYPELASTFDGPRPGIVHRLDRDTSGVIVVARTEAAAEFLISAFADRLVEKVYLALARGRVTPPTGVIDAPIARDPKRRQRMAAVPDGRPSRTTYRVIDTSGEVSWLELRPESGRTHQIRVHLKAIGHPVLGDPTYGRASRRIGRTALHAWRITFDHPLTGERVTFTAPLPDDMRIALAGLGLSGEPEGGMLTA